MYIPPPPNISNGTPLRADLIVDPLTYLIIYHL